MQMKSNTARMAAYSSVTVLVGCAFFLAICPGARRPFGRLSNRRDNAIANVPGSTTTHQPAVTRSNLPLRFEENEGQTARDVRFVSHGSGYELFLTPQEAVLALHPARRLDLSPTHRVAYFRDLREARKARRTSVVRMRLENANPAPAMAGLEPLPGRMDYFLGKDPANWRTHVSSYARVRYANVYPGVDLVFYGNQRRLEYDFIVAPGADPKAIALKMEGARKLRVNARGDLLASIAGGEVELQKPVVYQEAQGERREIAGAYNIAGGHRVTFAVAEYDRTKPLIVDPVLVYSTYLGGESDDSASAIALDSLGDVAVAGTTLSMQFPTTAGAFTQSPLASNTNGVVFVTKMDPTGTHQLYSSYVGGTGGDSGFAVALDGSGNIYVTGETASTDFPTTTNALKPGANAGNVNGTSFIFKIDPTVSGAGSLVYSSYLGGTQGVTEFGNGIATDTTGAVYVVGVTASQPGAALANFPVTSGAFQATPDPSNEMGSAFLAKLDTTQSGAASLIYATYLGGNGADAAGPGFGDAAFAVAEDAVGNSYLVGATTSTNFPTTTTAFQTAAPAAIVNGTVFVSRFDTTKTGLASLLYSTYLGGDSQDFGDAIALGPSNVAYVTGTTGSLLFPTTSGAFQTTGKTVGVTFVSLVDTSLTGSASLKYSTFLGASQTNSAFAIATDAPGIAYVAGVTHGSDFPVTGGAFQVSPAPGAPGGGFITKLKPAGLSQADLIYSTYFGGSGSGGVSDEVNAIAVNQTTNNAYIAGDTVSSAATFPIAPDPGAFQPALDGPSDGFVAELTLIPTPVPTLTVSPASVTFGPQAVGTPTAAQTVTLKNNSLAAIAYANAMISGGVPAAADNDFTSPANTCGTIIAAGASCTISVVFTPSAAGVETADLVITDADPSSPQTVTLSGTGTNMTAANFTVSASPTTLTVAQGASGTFKVTVTPAGGFNLAVSLACTGAPTMSTCTVAPTSVTTTDGVTPVAATVTVVTTSPALVAPPTSTPITLVEVWRTSALLLAFALLFHLARTRKLTGTSGFATALLAFLAIAGCSGGHSTPPPSGGTPKGTSALTVTGTSGALKSSATIALTVN